MSTTPTVSRRTLLAGAAGTAIAGSMMTAPTASAVGLGETGGCALGAYVKEDITVNRGISEPETLEAVIGRRLRLNHTFQQWAWDFPQAALQADVTVGRTPLLSWAAGPMNIVAETASGVNDEKVRGQARNLKALGAPVLMRFTWEMDLATRGYTDVETYKQAWRRVYQLFSEEDATNVSFVYCPTWLAYYGSADDARAYYPGDDYVDWLGVDGYARPWNDYSGLPAMFNCFHDFGSAIGKPMMIAETGVHHSGNATEASKWISRLSHDLHDRLPGIRACLYFDTTGSEAALNHWRIEGHAPSEGAIRKVANDPYMRVDF